MTPFFVFAEEFVVDNLQNNDCSDSITVSENQISLIQPRIWQSLNLVNSWIPHKLSDADYTLTQSEDDVYGKKKDTLKFSTVKGSIYYRNLNENACFNIQLKIKMVDVRKASYQFYGYLNDGKSFGVRYTTYSDSTSITENQILINKLLPEEACNGSWYTVNSNLQEELASYGAVQRLSSIWLSLMKFDNDDNIEKHLSFTDFKTYCNKGEYISSVIDLSAKNMASLTSLKWDEVLPEGTSIVVKTRTSETADENDWSNWREVENNIINSPTRNYLQFKIDFNQDGNNNEAASVSNIRVLFDRKPNKITTLSPENDKVLSDNDQLYWEADNNLEVSYVIELDDNPAFVSIDSRTKEIQKPEIYLKELENYNNLVNHTVYYWRVRAINEAGKKGDFSDIEKYFRLDRQNLNPNPPISGFSPCLEAQISDQEPKLHWNQAVDPDIDENPVNLSYIIQLDGNARFNNFREYETDAGQTEYKIPDKLEDNKTWYYRIKSRDSRDGLSDWSEIQSFYIRGRGAPKLFMAKTVGINNQQTASTFGINKLGMLLALVGLSCVSLIIIPRKRKKYAFDGAVGTTTKVESIVRARTRIKTIVTLIIIGGLAAAGLYLYSREKNPSPYTDDGKQFKINDEIIYRIDYKNSGKVDVKNLIIYDSFPRGIEYMDQSALVNGERQVDKILDDQNKVSFSLGNLAPNEAGYVLFRTKVSSDDFDNIENSGEVVYDGSEGIQQTNVVRNAVVKQEEVNIDVNQIQPNISVYGKGIKFKFKKIPPDDKEYYIRIKRLKKKAKKLKNPVGRIRKIKTNLNTLPENSFLVKITIKYTKAQMAIAGITSKKDLRLFIRTEDGWEKLKARRKKKKFIVKFNRFDYKNTYIAAGEK